MLSFSFPEPYILLLVVLAGMFLLFTLNKVRYDFVALGALVVLVSFGVIPQETMFSGFADTAVITIVSVFIFSKGLVYSGLIDYVSTQVLKLSKQPGIELLILMLLTGLLSGFINNVAAISLMIPIAVRIAKRHNRALSIFLIPLAFSSLLGGLSTSIGTPANIIISAEREKVLGEAFNFFDFAYVGYPLTLLGIIFLGIVGWHLIPKRRQGSLKKELFEIKDYITEVQIPHESPYVQKSLKSIESATVGNVNVLKLIREKEVIQAPSQFEVLKGGDILLLQSDSEALETLLNRTQLRLMGSKAVSEELLGADDEVSSIEAVVEHNSPIIDKSFKTLGIRTTYGINLLAVARENETIHTRLANTTFKAGDVLLLRGKSETLDEAIKPLGILPLMAHELRIGEPRKIALALIIMLGAVLSSTLFTIPVHLSFLVAAMAMVFTNILPVQQVYNSIEWKVVVLIGTLITIGKAFETTGSAHFIANFLTENLVDFSPLLIIGSVLVITTLVSNAIDGVAVAVVFAPVAILIAQGLGASPDPFLMAVSVGASTGFLTPFSAQPNALVMGPAGYAFSDYAKVGGFLSFIIVLIATPLIVYFWPLYSF
ncbi:MAG: SLC13 family permease [Candidatus Paceibacterota bacterium]